MTTEESKKLNALLLYLDKEYEDGMILNSVMDGIKVIIKTYEKKVSK